MELQSRRERLEEVLDRAGAVAALRTPETDLVREGAEHARQLWEVLMVEAERRTVMLDAVFHAQQYYTQATKAESWLSGQKLQVINEERGTVGNVLTLTLAHNITQILHSSHYCIKTRVNRSELITLDLVYCIEICIIYIYIYIICEGQLLCTFFMYAWRSFWCVYAHIYRIFLVAPMGERT